MSAWDMEAKGKTSPGDVEDGCRARTGEPLSRKQLALDIAATALLCVALLLAPGLFFLVVVAMLWKFELNLGVHIFFFLFLLAVMCLPCCTLCCHKRGQPCCAVERWLRRRKWAVMASVCLGTLWFFIFFMCLYHIDISTPSLRVDYDASLPVAVVGSGPSGLSSSWVLAKGGRQVTIFESADRIGGHSLSRVEQSNGRNLTIDLGFIFNNAAPQAYVSYKAFASHFGKTLVSTALNTSGHFDGQYWDNTGDPERFDPELKEEINRFMRFVNTPASTLRYLTPMALWLWWHGFSDRFRKLCMDSTLAVLFVTKMGLDKQSAQAVLNYFKTGEGFTHLKFDAPKVQFNPEGSQNMWRDVVADMQSTGRAQVRLNSRVTAVEKADGKWTLTLADGSKHGGFGDVVLACPASVASKVVQGRALQRYLVSLVNYNDASVTLHTDRQATIWPNFRQASDDVLYFVSDDHMTGKIGKIFQDPNADDLLLTVHGQEHAALNIDPAKTKWTTTWSHHYFSLFELALARKIVPFFNNGGGLHYSGDWLYGIGHNDAIKSGVHAACAAGVPPRPPDGSSDPLYSKLLSETCRLPS